MANLYSVAGSKLFIGNRMSGVQNVALEDFEGEEWTEVKNWVTVGTTGDTVNTSDVELVGNRRVVRTKTTIDGGVMENSFAIDPTDEGQEKIEGAVLDCRNFAFKIEYGADCIAESDVTISGGAVDWRHHGLEAGQPIVFETEGTLPAELEDGKIYYVIADGLTRHSFKVSATKGGTALTLTAGTGVLEASAAPVGMTHYFAGMVTGGQEQNGSATDTRMVNYSIAINSNIVKV